MDSQFHCILHVLSVRQQTLSVAATMDKAHPTINQHTTSIAIAFSEELSLLRHSMRSEEPVIRQPPELQRILLHHLLCDFPHGKLIVAVEPSPHVVLHDSRPVVERRLIVLVNHCEAGGCPFVEHARREREVDIRGLEEREHLFSVLRRAPTGVCIEDECVEEGWEAIVDHARGELRGLEFRQQVVRTDGNEEVDGLEEGAGQVAVGGDGDFELRGERYEEIRWERVVSRGRRRWSSA